MLNADVHTASPEQTRSCFVIMPFGGNPGYAGGAQESEAIFRDIIKPAVGDVAPDMTCFREDESKFQGSVTPSTFRHLRDAAIVIADLTGCNPNVSLELGVRLTLRGRGTVIICQDADNLPFNMRNWRVLPYAAFDSRVSRANIAAAIAAELASPEGCSPVWEAFGGAPWSGSDEAATPAPDDALRVGRQAYEMGLMDLAAGRHQVTTALSIPELLAEVPPGGEVLVVARSLAAWAQQHRALAKAVVDKDLTCILAMADPTDPTLTSPVVDDYAQVEVRSCWQIFRDNMSPYWQQLHRELGPTQSRGHFWLYGIPTYVPASFAAWTGKDGTTECRLEVGIGVGPDERPSMHFRAVGPSPETSICSRLRTIYWSMLQNRQPLLRLP